ILNNPPSRPPPRPQLPLPPVVTPPPPQQPRPVPAQRAYHNAPPPNDYVKPAPKRQHYHPLLESLEDIFAALMSHGVLRLPPRLEHMPPHADTSRYCPYHQAPRHTISTCFLFRDWVHDMNDAGRINWVELKATIAKMKKPPPLT